MANLNNERNLYEADWQGMYVVSEHWKSDIIFYKEDLNSLWSLKDKFNGLNKSKTKSIKPLLSSVIKEGEDFILKTDKHLTKIANIINTPLKYDSYQLRAEHAQLENEFINFVKCFRTSKIKIFAALDKLINVKELIH